ncbi:MAG: FHA domain-containing protein [Deltaproteobacteria bacterium]|nr:FHA domain-containing protein [Deltaproteobacteria bacterium]
MSERIRITADELAAPEVEQALARRRAAGRPASAGSPPVSGFRRVVFSPLFYRPVAGLVAAVAAWAIIEPHFQDLPAIGGEVTLVNAEPFELTVSGGFQFTVGRRDVYVLPELTRLEPGLDGQPAYRSVAAIEEGEFVEAVGLRMSETRLVAIAIRPATRERAAEAGQEIRSDSQWAGFVLMPLTGGLVALLLFLVEGMTSRNWVRMVERGGIGTLLAAVFSGLAMLPAGLLILLAMKGLLVGPSSAGFVTVRDVPGANLLGITALRSAAWAVVGAGLGLGMNLVRATRVELRNTVLGGTLGGALGGMFFDPIGRFLSADSLFIDAWLSRAVGLAAVGVAVGVFVALGERLAREGWLRVRTGPLAGKSFVLYRSPTMLGSSPRCEIYLFKDAEIAAEHAAIHRVGSGFELEDLGSAAGTLVGGRAVRRRRLQSGDTIVLGATVLEFEERAGRKGREGAR